jgi:RimJ/RimL family protein N-acetyltransferase
VTSERTSRSISPRPDEPAPVTLAPFGSEHLGATFAWLQDEELRAQIDSLGSPPTRSAHDAYWRRRLENPNDDAYAVVAGGQHVGNGGLLVDCARRKADLWLYLGERRGSGIGRAAAQLLLRRAFDELGLNRVGVKVLATNPRALGFWQSVGFREEGRAREDTWVGGQPVDAIHLSLLARERA